MPASKHCLRCGHVCCHSLHSAVVMSCCGGCSIPLLSSYIFTSTACEPQKACCLQDLQCACLGQVLSACPHLEQLTVEVVDLSWHPLGVQGWAEKLVGVIRDVQRSTDMARSLRRLQLVPTSTSVDLKSLWYVREPAHKNA